MKLVSFATLSVTALFVSAPSLRAQCCCKDKKVAITVAKTGTPTPKATAKATAKTTKKITKLFNEVCPITGNATSAKTPTVVHNKFAVSLCCAGCITTFAKLDGKKKQAFVARFTGKNQRTAFAKLTAKKVATKPCPDCDMKVVAKKDCCGEAKAKPAAKKGCCEEAKAKPAAKKDCCEEAKAKPAAKINKPAAKIN